MQKLWQRSKTFLFMLMLTHGGALFSDPDPYSIRDYLNEANYRLKRGQYDVALEILERAFKEDPDNLTLNFLMGRAAYMAEDYEEALFAYDRALIVDPDHPLARLERGRVLYAVGDLPGAKGEFQAVLSGEREIPDEARNATESLLCALEFPECRSFWAGTVRVGHTWDSNATLGAGSYALPGFPSLQADPTRRHDRIAYASVVASHQYLLFPSLTWQTVGYYHNGDNYRVDENDIEIWALSTGIQGFDECNRFAGRIGVSSLDLQDSSYQNHLRSEVTYDRVIDPCRQWGVSSAFTLRHHFAPPADPGTERQRGYLAQIDTHFHWEKNESHIFDANAYFLFDTEPRANTVPDRFHRLGLRLNYHFEWNPCFLLSMGGGYYHDDYWNQHHMFTSLKRCDNQTEAHAAIQYLFSEWGLLEVRGEHVRNRSNIPANDYESNRISIETTFTLGS